MNLGLTDKIAMVAGGSEGIGGAAARVLAAEGARVAVCARSQDGLDAIKRRIRDETGSDILTVSADFSRLEEIERFVDETVEHFGGVDILVNSAGSSMFGSFFQVPDEAWSSDFNLKFFGTVRASRLAIPHMRKRGGGRIVNVAGNSGKQPYKWHYPGGAANAAMLNFTHSLGQELAPDNILVTAVAPGPVETRRLEKQMHTFADLWGVSLEEAKARFAQTLPLGRSATADEVGYLIAFLVSNKAAYLTSTVVTIDGGITQGI